MTQYGQKVLYLSDLVRKFCLKQGNIKQTRFLRNMEFAAWAWKELYRKSIWEIKTVVLTVDENHNIRVPDDCERLVNISVLDKFGQLQPLSYNPDLSTVDILCQKGSCSCTSCGGVDSLCAYIDSITATQEQIEINGRFYTQVTYIRSNRCGDIQREVHAPVLDVASDEVVTVVNHELICKVEVNERGCILPTKPNLQALAAYCGYNGSTINNGRFPFGTAGVNPYRKLIGHSYNFYGQFNWNAASRDLIRIFRSPTTSNVYVNAQDRENAECCAEQNDIKKVIVSYQTSGYVEGEEILVPEYCEMAINTAMLYQQALFNPRDMDRNGSMEQKWRREKRRVEAYLNPVRMDDLIKIQTQMRYW